MQYTVPLCTGWKLLASRYALFNWVCKDDFFIAIKSNLVECYIAHFVLKDWFRILPMQWREKVNVQTSLSPQKRIIMQCIERMHNSNKICCLCVAEMQARIQLKHMENIYRDDVLFGQSVSDGSGYFERRSSVWMVPFTLCASLCSIT